MVIRLAVIGGCDLFYSRQPVRYLTDLGMDPQYRLYGPLSTISLFERCQYDSFRVTQRAEKNILTLRAVSKDRC